MGSDREQSEFNMAVSYLNRLNALFYVADEASIELNAYQWFHSLMALFRELSTEMKPVEIEAWSKEKIPAINSLVSEHLKNNNSQVMNQMNPDLYDKLHNFELFIRKILKDSGLQNKMQESPGQALD